MTDTIELLKELDSGCQMAMNSIHQLQNYELNKDLADLLEKYRKKHHELKDEVTSLLREHGEDEKMPGTMASAMSWVTTGFKMMMHDTNTQVAKLMMDGCNMGIQTIGEKMSMYAAADQEAKKLAHKLITLEEDFAREVKEFL